MCQDGGALLCAVDEAHDHSISVWDWQKGDKGYKITETKVSSFNQYHKIKKKLFCKLQFIILMISSDKLMLHYSTYNEVRVT